MFFNRCRTQTEVQSLEGVSAALGLSNLHAPVFTFFQNIDEIQI